MATSPEYKAYVLDLMTPHYPVQARGMFGGVGIFSEWGMFALITSDDELHFKVDDSNRADYEDAGMPQFQRMPYYRVPEEVLESPEELGVWMGKSLQVAQNSPKKK
ncbi:MAG: TfoX/Sxy family protein [Caldilineales bacterium]|nr:TfoX/Sxy family protein [Caldilineales bacterium]